MRTTIIIVLLGLLLAGCGASDPETTSTPTGALATPTEAPSQNAELLAKVGRGPIHDLVYTPNGKFVLVAFETGLGALEADKLEIAAFWDLPSAPMRLAFLAGKNEVAVLTAGAEILFVGLDPVSGAFSASQRAVISSVREYPLSIVENFHLAASPNGKYLAFSAVMSTRAWNLETGQAIYTLNNSSAGQLSFTNDSSYLLVGENSSGSILVSLADGKVVWSEKGKSQLVNGQELIYWNSPESYYIAPVSAPNSGRKMGSFSSDGQLIFSPDGTLGIYVRWNDNLVPFETMTGKAVLNYEGSTPHLEYTEAPLYLSNQGVLFTNKEEMKTSSSGKPVEIILTPLFVDLKSGKPLYEVTSSPEILNIFTAIVFSPDGKSAVYADIYSNTTSLTRVEFDTQKIITFTDQLGSGVTALAFAPDGKTLAVGGQSFNVTSFDTSQGLQEVRREPLPIQTTEGTVYYNHQSQSRWFRGVTGLAFSPNGKHLLASTSSGFLYLLASDGEQSPFAMGIHEKVSQKGGVVEIFGLSISPDSQVIATGGAENAVRLWSGLGGLITSQRENGAVFNISYPAGSVSQHLLEDASMVTFVTYAPSGNLIAAGTEKGLIRLWRADGTLERTLSGHTGRITGLTFAGETLVSASEDGTVRFWQMNDGAQTGLLTISESITSLALDPRGELLALGTLGGKTYLWEMMGTRRWLGMISGAPV